MKLVDLFSGTRVLYQTHSKYNGDVQVIKDFTWGTYVKAGGLTQSGGVLTNIWKTTVKDILKQKPIVKNCLILGLGAGSVARLVSQYWITADIVGVDIDPKMVQIGKKYFGLSEIKINTKISDAYNFVSRSKTKYDLVLVDLYCGDKFPEKFTNDKFLKNVKKLLNKNGIAVFNRLYGKKYKHESDKFRVQLEKHFKKVDYIMPQANVELICYN